MRATASPPIRKGVTTPQGAGSWTDSAAYNPATRTWRPLPEAPQSRWGHAQGVWTGQEAIIWGAGDGSELTPIAIPLDFTVLLLVPDGEQKASTADVYRRFDEGRGADGFETRRAALREAVEHLDDPRDLAALPRNDLALIFVLG